MLENKELANQKVATPFGDITFDEKGQTKELTVAQQKELGNVKGFTYIEDKKAPAKKTTTTQKKTTTTKRATTKKPSEGEDK